MTGDNKGSGNSLKNPYIHELNKFFGSEVEVIDDRGDVYKGICRGINFQHLNMIIMTKDEKILVRNIRVVKRKRNKGKY